MFKRLRSLEISLAAKCQLLFGAAVVLIIGAALFVPWQRMEQLTEQLNERSARTLIDYAVNAHTVEHQRDPATTRPFASDTALAVPPSTQPAARDASAALSEYEVEAALPPRLILTALGRDESQLTPFERRSIRRLIDHPDR